MQTLARFAIKRRWFVIGGWIATIFLAQFLSSAAGGAAYKDVFKLPHTETATVSNLLANAGFSSQSGFTGTMVAQAKTGTLDSPPDGMVAALQHVCTLGDSVTSITTPWTTINCLANGAATAGNPKLLSADKTVALNTITWSKTGSSQTIYTDVYHHLKSLGGASYQVFFTGDAFAAISSGGSLGSAELLGIVTALIILSLVFQTFGGMALPLLSALVALVTGFGLIGLLSHVMNVADFASELAALMVIGVGVDYALFIVTRHKRNLLRGMDVDESIVLAINTSGRAVFFAGLTVCIALLGLLALNVSFLYGVAVGTALAVALTVVASLTLLPALLHLLGRRILPRSQREALPSDQRVKLLLCIIPPVCFVFWILYGLEYLFRNQLDRRHQRAAENRAAHKGFWLSWSRLVENRSAVLGIIAGAFIIVLAIPFFSMQLGHADQSNDPANTTTRQGYDLIAKEFGAGYNSTLEAVVYNPNGLSPAFVQQTAAALAQVPDINAATIRPTPLNKTLVLVSFKSVTAPEDHRTTELVGTLRHSVLPKIYNGTGNHIYVYGATAVFVDFASVISSKIPLFFAAVVGLSFLLLMVAFRSVVVPLTAAAMNLLAAAASFGLVVAIFQWGWGSELLGIGKGGPIEPFLPVIFFAILFGLSMDYQVFLVSRMHEEWIHTGDNKRAVSVGQAETGGIITAAAIIMISVFAGFLLGNGRVIKLFGLGLGGAVFLDAFVLRTVLVPALMHRIGKWNWYIPRWLDRILPHVSVEGASTDDTHGDERELVTV